MSELSFVTRRSTEISIVAMSKPPEHQLKNPILSTAILFVCFCLINPLSAQTVPVTDPEVNSIFQYFVAPRTSNARFGSGAYLWIPPKTPTVRAVMVGIHNGLPLTILQSPAVRAVCRRYGIAQILFTPNGSDIGPVMLKGLNYDVSDPSKTAVYDYYLRGLAEISEHPELVKAPIVPLAHSAYMDFPFNAAMRDPDQCLAAIPIKAGTPDLYAFYAKGGKSMSPRPDQNLRNVPLIVLDSAAQETVVSRWKSMAYPQVFEPNFMGAYRRDRNDNPGTSYEPRDELCGGCWDQMSGHFDMFPRNYQFIADWLAAIAEARLPDVPESPLKVLTLKDGWLMDPRVPTTEQLGEKYALPAPYLQFKGDRSRALWFPNEQLARGLFELERNEALREVELFTVLDPKGKPISLAETPMATMPDTFNLLKGDGRFTLATWHYTTPPQICTVTARGHRVTDPHVYGNPLFPGKTKLELSDIPLHFNLNGTPVKLLQQAQFTDSRGVAETRFELQLQCNRLAPDPGGLMFFRIYHEGNDRFTATGRTVQINWDLNSGKKSAEQTLTFPPVPDAPVTAEKFKFNATSTAGIPVGYFVQKGPGIIEDGAFVPSEIPAGRKTPIEVTIGAYQVGIYTETGGVKPAKTVYQTFKLIP